ncbi:exodeoxyribonuclease VII small subunit [Curvibacter gracilis]|uniref:exodeoxyribonuclease VII small subunit n=1 Tax=Curvibacter gracilis TaxID=230310 RepID=UPI0004847D16|nr:exodeoxyribonuclease VII small subunit [Curvibacter gracilis]
MKHSFKESYGVLQRHAQTLREQREPNIDDLLQIVEESVSAFKICQARIDAVEKALEKELGEPQRETVERSPVPTAPTASKPAPKTASKTAAPATDDDDDVPF